MGAHIRDIMHIAILADLAWSSARKAATQEGGGEVLPQVTSQPLHSRLDTRLPGATEAAPWLALASQWDQAVFAFGVFIAAQGVHADLASVHHDRE